MKRNIIMLAVSSSLVAAISGVAAQHTVVRDQELMDKLKDAAPAAVLKGATILKMGPKGEMTVIRTGTNGWTCMDPGGAPMCADTAAMEWGKAWQSKGPTPQKLGFIYMLNGDNGASNTDPYATEETPDNNWIKTGSHVMIVGRGQEHDARLPKGRQARSREALCDVAGNALRTLDAAGQVRLAGRDCDPTPLGAIVAGPRAEANVARGQRGWLAWREGVRVEYKKAPDRPRDVAFCGHGRGKSYKPGRKQARLNK